MSVAVYLPQGAIDFDNAVEIVQKADSTIAALKAEAAEKLGITDIDNFNLYRVDAFDEPS